MENCLTFHLCIITNVQCLKMRMLDIGVETWWSHTRLICTATAKERSQLMTCLLVTPIPLLIQLKLSVCSQVEKITKEKTLPHSTVIHKQRGPGHSAQPSITGSSLVITSVRIMPHFWRAQEIRQLVNPG